MNNPRSFALPAGGQNTERRFRLFITTLNAFFAFALTSVIGAQAAANAPTIRLFPTTVLEDIKHTGQVAKEMETGLQEIIGRLDKQQQLYIESKCDGAEGDPGCAQIAKQLGATYLEMLNNMGERLPEMEQAVNSTRVSLEKRLRNELGQKMTPWSLQEMLLGDVTQTTGVAQGSTNNKHQPTLRGRSGMRLSDRFRHYYQLVAHGGNGGSNSLAVVASDIYLDMREASALIARTREEINRASLMEQLNQSFGLITPEMQQIVSGVKSILFGETDDAPPIAGAAPAAKDQAYRSPLTL